MNFLFRTFILFGALVVLALFSALIAPLFIDWQQFTDDFEKQATRVVGQPVKVGGDTRLRLLPLPFVSFEDLEVGGRDNGTPLMTVERFSLQAELLPFLSGKVQIVEMSMHKPQLDLVVEENGTVAWTTPSEPIVDPELVKIERLLIEGGTAKISGLAGGRTLKIDNVAADLSARSVLGPWNIDGTGDVDGVRSTFAISTGSYQRSEKSIRLRVTASKNDRPYRLAIDGPLKLNDNVLSWSGGFELDPFSAKDLATMDNPEVPLPIGLDGIFSATPDGVVVPEYRLEIGEAEDPYVVTGQAQAQIREKVFFRLEADGRQIDLDRIQQNGTDPEQKFTLESRLGAVRSILDRVPVPDAEGEIDIILPAIVAGDTFIRDVKAVIRPYGRGWDVRSLKAQFPGNTTLEASGRVGLRQDYGFAGRLLVASRQPSGFASWVTGSVSPQIRRLRSVGLDSRVTLSANQVRFDDLELRLDDAVMTGRLQRIGSKQGKPAIIAELAGNRINTEELRALYSLARSNSEDDLVTHDLNVKVKAGRFESVIKELPIAASDVDAQVLIRDGSVSVERFNARNLLGATFESTGRIEDALSRPNGNLKLNVSAKQGSQLFDFANRLVGGHPSLQKLVDNPALVEQTRLEIELDTTSSDNRVKGIGLVKGAIAGSAIDGRLAFDGALADGMRIPVDFSSRFTNADPSVLLQQLGVETFPVDLAGDVPGPLSISVSAKGTGESGLESQVGFTAPGTNLTLQGNVTLSGSSLPNINMATTIGASDLMPWLRLSGVPLPYNGDSALPVSARFNLILNEEISSAENLSGQISGNEFSGSLKLERKGRERPRLTGDLELSHLPIELISETAFGRFAALDLVSGVLPEEELSFGDPLYTGFDANIRFKAGTVALGEVIGGTEGKLELVMIDGAVDLNSVSFQSLGGELSGSGSLKNTNGTVLARGNFLLDNFDAGTLARELGYPELLSGKAKLSATLETSGLSTAGLVSNLAGNGFVQLSGIKIYGLDPNKFDQILRVTDVEDYEVKQTEIQKLIEENVLSGGLEISQIDAPLSISRGRLRLRNVSHQSDTSKLNANLEVEILDRNAEADVSVAFVPGRRDAIAGADPQIRVSWQGPLGLLERAIDSSQLEGYLSLRAFEDSQRRLETLEARVIEKQRHLRQIALTFAQEKKVKRDEEKARLILEQERLAREEAARIQSEEAARLLEEERIREEEEAKRAAEEQRLIEDAKRVEAEQRAAAEAARIVAPTPAPKPNSSGIRSTPLAPVRRTQPAPPKPEPVPEKPKSILDALENLLNSSR